MSLCFKSNTPSGIAESKLKVLALVSTSSVSVVAWSTSSPNDDVVDRELLARGDRIFVFSCHRRLLRDRTVLPGLDQVLPRHPWASWVPEPGFGTSSQMFPCLSLFILDTDISLRNSPHQILKRFPEPTTWPTNLRSSCDPTWTQNNGPVVHIDQSTCSESLEVDFEESNHWWLILIDGLL